MSDSNYSALMLIIDRSGSMSSIRDDMVGGLTTLVEAQEKLPGLLTISMVSFDNEVELQHQMATPDSVKIQLEPRGMTALYDAMGFGLNTLQASIDALPDHAKPGTVQVVVVTDGAENASSEYTGSTVKQLVIEKTTQHNWDIVFLGANQDAVMKAAELGIEHDRSMTYGANSDGVTHASESLNRYVSDRRSGSKTQFSPEERRRSSGS
ncbi:VWA domain-containing protein [Pontimonas sp.]|nr:VWA domain-containing protein [Pontimonas sp.]